MDRGDEWNGINGNQIIFFSSNCKKELQSNDDDDDEKKVHRNFSVAKIYTKIFFYFAASAPETRNSFLNNFMCKEKNTEKNVVRGLRSCPMALMNIETFFLNIRIHSHIGTHLYGVS